MNTVGTISLEELKKNPWVEKVVDYDMPVNKEWDGKSTQHFDYRPETFRYKNTQIYLRDTTIKLLSLKLYNANYIEFQRGEYTGDTIPIRVVELK